MLKKLLGLLSSDMAIDLGTANTLVYVSGKGIMLNEPSVVAFSKDGRHIVPRAFGHQAKLMLGRTPAGINAIRPLKDGVIADFRCAEEMIKYFISTVHKNRKFLARPRIIVCVPYGSTPVERRAIQDAVESAGARDVRLIYEPMAAAIGANLPVTDPTGSMIVDIGGGTTEVGVMSLGGIVESKSVRVGGDTFDSAVINYIRKNHNLLIGESTSEKIKKNIGSAFVGEEEKVEFMKIRGRDIIHGIPKQIKLNSKQIAQSLLEPVKDILQVVKDVLESAPPELSSDIVDRGIVLTGGGALLKSIDKVIKEGTGLPVFIAEDCLSSVALGTGKVLDNFEELEHVLFQQD